jgi:hypothetical protein
MKKTYCDGDSCTHTTDDPHYDGWHTLYNATSGYDLDLCPTCYSTALILDRGTGHVYLGDTKLTTDINSIDGIRVDTFANRTDVTLHFTPSAMIFADSGDSTDDDTDDADSSPRDHIGPELAHQIAILISKHCDTTSAWSDFKALLGPGLTTPRDAL